MEENQNKIESGKQIAACVDELSAGLSIATSLGLNNYTLSPGYILFFPR